MAGIFETITNTVTGKVQRMALVDKYGESVLFDVTKSFSRTFENDITEHAIEEGASISDNAKALPVEINLSVSLSDSDYLGIAGVKILRDKTISERYDWLKMWRDYITFPLKLITDEEEIENLVIKSIAENRAAGDGNGKSLELVLKQITVVKASQAQAGINVQGYKPKAAAPKEPNATAQGNLSLAGINYEP